MKSKCLGRGSGRKVKFSEMGRLGEKNVGIQASCLEVSTANYRLRGIFHGGQPPTRHIFFRGLFLKLCIVGATAHMEASNSLLLWTMQHVSVNF
jgi:hypothetical protein